MKSLLLAVLTLVTLLPTPVLAATRIKAVLPKKTKNTCIRKVARLAASAKHEAALEQLADSACTEDTSPEESLWVSLMEGVLYHGLGETTQSENAFCRAFLQDVSAKLPVVKPPRPLRDRFEELRSECLDKAAPPPVQAEAPLGDATRRQAVARATPPPAVGVAPAPTPATPPAVQPAPASVSPAPTEPAPTEPAPTKPAPTEPAPTEPTPAEATPTEPTPAPARFSAFELHAGVRGDAEFNPRDGLLPLGGVSLQGSVHLVGGLRGGVGLSLLNSPRFLPRPIFVVLADARLFYPLLRFQEGVALHLYATGGPLLYTLNSTALGGRAGLGLALDWSRLRIALGGAYEWRNHYRLDSSVPMVGLEVGWKLVGDAP